MAGIRRRYKALAVIIVLASAVVPTFSDAQEKPSYFKALPAAAAQDLEARITRLSTETKVSRKALMAIADAWGFDFKDKPLDDFMSFMAKKAADTQALLDEVARLQDELAARPEARQSLDSVYALIKDGRLDDAEAALAALASGRDAAFDFGLKDWGDLVEARAKVLTLSGRPYEASRLRLEAAATIEDKGRQQAWQLTFNAAYDLYKIGDLKGDNAALAEAIRIYREEALPRAPRDRAPLDWAKTQSNLGNTLATLGERESGTERLEQAVIAYDDALKERTRDRVPLDWAQTQNNLGNALASLGERESGTERLEQAVAAYNEALKERTRDRLPLDWAQTQNNLGLALLALGQRESGTEHLEQAVAAYDEALKERTRDRVPLQWAMTQNNLALVYETFYTKTGNREYIATALAYAYEALDVYEQAALDYYSQSCHGLIARLEAL